MTEQTTRNCGVVARGSKPEGPPNFVTESSLETEESQDIRVSRVGGAIRQTTVIEYATQTELGKLTANDVRVVAKVNDDIKQNPAY